MAFRTTARKAIQELDRFWLSHWRTIGAQRRHYQIATATTMTCLSVPDRSTRLSNLSFRRLQSEETSMGLPATNNRCKITMLRPLHLMHSGDHFQLPGTLPPRGQTSQTVRYSPNACRGLTATNASHRLRLRICTPTLQRKRFHTTAVN